MFCIWDIIAKLELSLVIQNLIFLHHSVIETARNNLTFGTNLSSNSKPNSKKIYHVNQGPEWVSLMLALYDHIHSHNVKSVYE